MNIWWLDEMNFWANKKKMIVEVVLLCFVTFKIIVELLGYNILLDIDLKNYMKIIFCDILINDIKRFDGK